MAVQSSGFTIADSVEYTALAGEHRQLGATFTDFGGWQMPLKYGSELAEHHAVRRSAGIFDLSHMGEVWVTGAEAAAFLDYALAGKITAMPAGKAKYSLICTEDGGIIDDLITYRRATERFLVVPNAGNTDAPAIWRAIVAKAEAGELTPAGRSHCPVLKDGTVIGEVTSGQPSPTLGTPIALAYVDVEYADLGTAVDVDLRGTPEPFEVTAVPFYQRQK